MRVERQALFKVEVYGAVREGASEVLGTFRFGSAPACDAVIASRDAPSAAGVGNGRPAGLFLSPAAPGPSSFGLRDPNRRSARPPWREDGENRELTTPTPRRIADLPRGPPWSASNPLGCPLAAPVAAELRQSPPSRPRPRRTPQTPHRTFA